MVTVATGTQVEVYNPMGYPPKIEQLGMAPRLDTLEGKTVYLVDARFDDGDILMQQMAAWFNDNMPSVKTVVARKSGIHGEDDPDLWAEIKAKADACILGVGH